MNNKVLNAAKWSILCEILAKIIAPITTIILARLLSHEVFGIVASLTAITSFADLLADAGFNAYIIQHQFSSDEEKKRVYNISFWSNFGIACILFFIIIINSESFSRLVGAAGYNDVLIIASIVIPLVSISSIEMAIMKKELEFKKLGIIRIVSKLVPFFVTIPLAFCGAGYWSLVIGTLVGETIGTILSIRFGGLIPKFSYKFVYLRGILSFSIWAYLESILEWLISNIAILCLATIYGMAELGVFKVGINLINQITTSVYSLYSNVYKSAISKEQNDRELFRNIFLNFQRYASLFSLPLGVGVYLYKDTVTQILLGDGWQEAAIIIGLYGLTSTISISYGNFYSDAIRAKGFPRLLVYIDAIYLFSIGVLLLSAQNIDFRTFCVFFCALKIIQPLMQVVIGRKICSISIKCVLKNSLPQIIATSVVFIIVVWFNLNKLQSYQFIAGLCLCIFTYIAIVVATMPEFRSIDNIKNIIKRNNSHGE